MEFKPNANALATHLQQACHPGAAALIASQFRIVEQPGFILGAGNEPSANAAMHRALGDGEISWEAVGTGAPVVLLHGFSFDRGMWDRQVPALSGAHRVFRYDLRGFGASSLPTSAYSHVDDLRRLLEHWGLPSATLVGLSLGANVALEFASLHPDRVDRLVLASPGLSGHAWSEDRPPDMAMEIGRTAGRDAAKASWLAHPMFASLMKSEGADAFTAMVERYHGWHWGSEDPRMQGPNLAGQLSGIDVPMLVVSGGQDVPGYQAIARRIAAEAPRASLHVFPDAGHVMPMEAPDLFNAAVAQFLGHAAAAEGNPA
jgi:3-oxoadipate enol-lactonase